MWSKDEVTCVTCLGAYEPGTSRPPNFPPRPPPPTQPSLISSVTMSALRFLAATARRAPQSARALGRRGYAEAADKIKLSLALPHQVRTCSILFGVGLGLIAITVCGLSRDFCVFLCLVLLVPTSRASIRRPTSFR
jgi:hypothetical protein